MGKRKKLTLKNRDGQQLEKLITQIESALIPKGFKVECRRKLFDDDGIQYAEFDIVITGLVGSIPVTCLIECRDRQEAAPGAWIEQLMGRQRRFGFQKVVAVATGGFSPSALDAAKTGSIEVRSVSSITEAEVAAWFPVFAPLEYRNGHLTDVQICLADDAGCDESIRLDTEAPTFAVTWSSELQSTVNLWKRIVNTEKAWTGIAADGVPVVVSLLASEFLTGIISSRADGTERTVEDIRFDGIFRSTQSVMQMTG